MSARATRRLRQLQRQEMRSLCSNIIRRLRAVLAQRGPDYYARFPNAPRPCATCAFNPSTDSWPGFEKTVLGLIKALGTGGAFYCHKNLPRDPEGDWVPLPLEEMEVCGGWAVVGFTDEAERVLADAILEEAGDDRRLSQEQARAVLRSAVLHESMSFLGKPIPREVNDG